MDRWKGEVEASRDLGGREGNGATATAEMRRKGYDGDVQEPRCHGDASVRTMRGYHWRQSRLSPTPMPFTPHMDLHPQEDASPSPRDITRAGTSWHLALPPRMFLIPYLPSEPTFSSPA